MKEIFISYSRKDTAIADQICAALDGQGISYFIDRKGIGGGMEFPDVLADGILECRIMLFLASKNSYDSKYTKKEITFAFNEKPSGSILPYIIDGSKLPNNLRFTFADVNIRTLKEHPIETILMQDLCQLLGRKYVNPKSVRQEDEPERLLEERRNQEERVREEKQKRQQERQRREKRNRQLKERVANVLHAITHTFQLGYRKGWKPVLTICLLGTGSYVGYRCAPSFQWPVMTPQQDTSIVDGIPSSSPSAISVVSQADTLTPSEAENASVEVTTKESPITQAPHSPNESQVTTVKAKKEATTATSPTPLSENDRFVKAMDSKDWATVEALANKGFSLAYYELAYHYWSIGNATLCRKWAEKAIAANVNAERARVLLKDTE